MSKARSFMVGDVDEGVPKTRFREEMTTRAADPFSVILRRKKIPMALLVDTQKASRMNLLETETFESTFGGKSTRKRPKVASMDYEALLKKVQEEQEKYQAPDHT
jgi:nuclear GTP-binding protein